MEPQPAGAAQRPHRPASASTRPRWTSSTSSRRAGKARARQGSAGRASRACGSLSTTGRASALEDELYFLYVAAKKVDQIREDLGSAGEVIAAQIEQKMLGKRADWQSADVEIARRASNAELKINRELARDLEKLTGTLAESRGDLNLSPADRGARRPHRAEARSPQGPD